MPLKIVHPNHYEIIGRGFVLLSSPPILSKTTDLHTGTLTEEIALLSKCHAIIGKEKKLTDLSEMESVRSQFTTGIREFLADHGIRFILEIRGKKEPGLEIKTAQSASEANEILEIVKTAFAMSFPVKVTGFSPEEKPMYSDSDVQTVVLDLGPDERGFQRESIVDVAAEMVGLVNGKLGFSESDEGVRDVLD
jgi:hypothetical protein